MHDCIFCKIVKGEIPSKKVYEDDDVLAFLDINPANKGHTLVTTKKHYDSIFDVEEEELKKMIIVTKKIAVKVKEAFKADGLNIVQNNGQHAGQLVSHIHFHVIPRFPDDKVVITYQRQHMSEHELKEVQDALKEEKKEKKHKEEKAEIRLPRLELNEEDWEL